MVKLGQQVKVQVNSLPTRSERKQAKFIAGEEKKERAKQSQEAQDKLSKATTIEEYEQIYNNLNDFQRSSFKSPDTLRSEQEQKRQEDLQKLDDRKKEVEAQLNKYEKRLREARSRDEEHDADIQIQYYEGYQSALNEGKSQLVSGSNLTYVSIIDYAQQKADYQAERRRARYEKKAIEEKKIKDLEERNKEAQAKGFTFTGTIKKSFVDPKTKQETVQGVRYFIGGAEVSPQDFAKRYDIYTRPSGSQLIVPKGSQILTEQTAQSISAQDFARRVESLPVAEQEQETTQKSIFKKFLDTTSDVLSGYFLKSTVGLGTRGFATGEPTGLSGAELEERRQSALDLTTIFGFTRGELVRGEKTENKTSTLSSILGIGIPGLFDLSQTQLAGIQLSREVRESGERTTTQQRRDVQNIQTGASQLESLDKRVTELNQQVREGRIQPQVAQARFEQIDQERFEVFRTLASQGIRTNVQTDEKGVQTVSFTSPALETDVAPASVKLLRQTDTVGRTQLITGGLATEFLEFSTLGLLTGRSGAPAKLGTLVTKVPRRAQLAGATLFGGLLFARVGVSGVQGIERGEEAGIGKVGGFALGAGIPLTQTVAFAGGAYVGSQIYTENLLRRLERGGFTRPVERTFKVEGKEVKAPTQARAGKTTFREGQPTTTTVKQADQLRTKIPGTDIEIETTGRLRGAFVDKQGRSVGEVINRITGQDAGAYRGVKVPSRILYFDQNGKTGIVAFTKTPKGVRVDQFRTGVNIRDFRLLTQSPEGAQTVFVDFNRYVEQIGSPIFVRGATLSDKSITSILKARIDYNRFFTSFVGEDKLFTVGRTQQVVSITPKVEQGATLDTGAGTIRILSQTDQTQNFASIGSSRVARTDALKSLVDQIVQREGGLALFKKALITNKRGQVALPTFVRPERLTQSPTITLPSSIFSQDVGLTAISPLTNQLQEVIRSSVSQNTLTGVLAILGSGSGLAQGRRVSVTQRVNQLQLQNLINEQATQQITAQQTIQKQQQQQQQQQSPLVETTPILTPQLQPPVTTPPFSALPGIPALPDFDLQLVEQVRKRAKKKKTGRELFVVEDFVSKALNLPPIEVTPKQLQLLGRQTQTGFEIRRRVVVKKESKDQKTLRRLLNQ